MKAIKKTMLCFLVVCFVLAPAMKNYAADGQWKLSSGRWYYQRTDGTVIKDNWMQDKDQSWYHFDKEGYMQTGWLNLNNVWYFLMTDGRMKTGWLNHRDSWYYFSTGGVMKTGWQQVNGKWYYMDSSGAMRTSWRQIDNKWYYMDSSGAMKTGWLETGGKWYFLEPDGSMIASTTRMINGNQYTFGADGAWTGIAGGQNTNTGFAIGSWSDRAFTNTWSNIKITVPSDSTIYTSQQMRDVVGTSEKILVNDGTITGSKANAYPDTTIYDFMFRLNDGNTVFQLSYLNIYSAAASITTEQYVVSHSDSLAANATLPRTIEGTERVTLAGNEYIKLRTTMLSRTVYQDFYMRKADHYIVMLTVTYQPANVGSVNSIISNITTAR